jgi:hypothetical protein
VGDFFVESGADEFYVLYKSWLGGGFFHAAGWVLNGAMGRSMAGCGGRVDFDRQGGCASTGGARADAAPFFNFCA